ncbi:hypothetical protein Sme01_57270 [Sphaerisporangium melleum]|uniref:Methyltransferase type 11 domain-containing protein n=1 Tax=Sphaerisporangium melleum TaxID=321316 RepID=A0A917VLY3_9ACTN|nr:class I SAM-dependent methyltransferase [Sphaerisporangium melleum]GGK94528.1 hypothetical protein GCM10007964_41150 [Sphaerisporangium melleum]GII73251.1 hypothetical protein Sme01_57270 [Sphaerisporangium melleum]
MSTPGDAYAVLGRGYAARRRPDPRIAALIGDSLGPARTVLNVGAGTGSYEPADRAVLAVEPSAMMIRQRPAEAAPVVQASAEALPLGSGSFDAGMAILTVHHWTDLRAGLRELRRVSRRQVILTWDPEVTARFWLVEDYLPELAVRERDLAALNAVRDCLAHLGAAPSVLPVPIPADCTDGFAGAYWRRPHAYLDADIRAAMSPVMLLDQSYVRNAMHRLSGDLGTGAWHKRNAGLLARGELDLGYRLVVT